MSTGVVTWNTDAQIITRLLREKEELRRAVEWLESCNKAAMDECQLLATRIADLELQVRALVAEKR